MLISSLANTLSLRRISTADLSFLYQVYASTRWEELAVTGWPQTQIDLFLHAQFNMQHDQWQQHYPKASFDVILLNEVPVGRLYVDRRETEIRIIDIAILPKFRGRGIGTHYLTLLKEEAKHKGLNLSLHVEKQNHARALYVRMGFKVVQEGDVYDLMEVAV